MKIWRNENIDMRTDTNKKDVKSTDITIQAGRNGFKWELSYGNTALEELIWSPSVCAHFIQFSLVITPTSDNIVYVELGVEYCGSLWVYTSPLFDR